ncbi:MAG TPA: CPBP family intramembrane glutamic endopeptidase [Nitrospiria bacterium]|nr:CPBP family intramembrane glutamic endopeptidase [Nitrospiria bacterium]
MAERFNWLVFIPILANILYYLLPPKKANTALLFFPQILSYVMMIAWSCINKPSNIRINTANYKASIIYGFAVGLITGATNLFFILKVTGWLGQDYEFLRETPHAKMPFLLMMPFGIILISAFVEINFRGFILSRFLTIFRNSSGGAFAAIAISSIVFATDPFMLFYFKIFAWLALFDGLIWGYLYYRTGNILGPIAAHSICVMIVYTILKVFYS